MDFFLGIIALLTHPVHVSKCIAFIECC